MRGTGLNAKWGQKAPLCFYTKEVQEVQEVMLCSSKCESKKLKDGSLNFEQKWRRNIRTDNARRVFFPCYPASFDAPTEDQKDLLCFPRRENKK